MAFVKTRLWRHGKSSFARPDSRGGCPYICLGGPYICLGGPYICLGGCPYI